MGYMEFPMILPTFPFVLHIGSLPLRTPVGLIPPPTAFLPLAHAKLPSSIIKVVIHKIPCFSFS